MLFLTLYDEWQNYAETDELEYVCSHYSITNFSKKNQRKPQMVIIKLITSYFYSFPQPMHMAGVNKFTSVFVLDP